MDLKEFLDCKENAAAIEWEGVESAMGLKLHDSVLILLNNDTGKVEWMDCGYGYFKEYEKNPNGILADSTEAFWGEVACCCEMRQSVIKHTLRRVYRSELARRKGEETRI